MTNKRDTVNLDGPRQQTALGDPANLFDSPP
jgi:hypothetical protein